MALRLLNVVPVAHALLSATSVEQQVSVRPLAYLVPGFASPEECARILELLERCHSHSWEGCNEQRSGLANKKKVSTDGKSNRPLRNSTSFTVTLDGELEPTMDTIVRRGHLLARHPITHGEGVQIASYYAGDYYGFHHDSLSRRATFLLYLTDVAEGEGGETIFPLVRAPGVPEDAEPPLPPAVVGHYRDALDFKVERMEEMRPYCESDFYLKVRPEAGKALLFYSYGPDMALDEYAIHGACPMRGPSHKAILQRWMRFDKNSLYDKAEDIIREARVDWGKDVMLPIGPSELPSTTAEPLAARHRRRDSLEPVAPVESAHIITDEISGVTTPEAMPSPRAPPNALRQAEPNPLEL